MRGKRFTEEKIIGILKEAEAGVSIQEICRKYGMSEATFYNWKAKYGGLTVSEAKRLKRLEDENRRLKHIVADLTLDNQVLKAVIEKNL
jgi:putative transposase